VFLDDEVDAAIFRRGARELPIAIRLLARRVVDERMARRVSPRSRKYRIVAAIASLRLTLDDQMYPFAGGLRPGLKQKSAGPFACTRGAIALHCCVRVGPIITGAFDAITWLASCTAVCASTIVEILEVYLAVVDAAGFVARALQAAATIADRSADERRTARERDDHGNLQRRGLGLRRYRRRDHGGNSNNDISEGTRKGHLRKVARSFLHELRYTVRKSLRYLDPRRCTSSQAQSARCAGAVRAARAGQTRTAAA